MRRRPETRRWRPAPAALALGLLLTPGCGPRDPEAARGAWLQSTLIEDNFDLLVRDPAIVAEKFAKMASSPYAYYRGTLGQFLRDAARARWMPPLPRSGDAETRVMVVGDPHPENLGTFRPTDGIVVLDFNDYDAARFGPWRLDLRRLALGYLALAESAPQLSGAGWPDRMAQAVAQGYAEARNELAAGDARRPIRRGSGAGRAIEDLFQRAQRDGLLRTELSDYQSPLDPTRLRRGEIQPRLDPGYREDEVIDASEGEARLVEALLEGYEGPTPLTLSDLARQLGQGVTSYPNLRFLALVQAADGPHVLELKEERDAPFLKAPQFPPRKYPDNAARVVAIQRQLQSQIDDDPWLAAVATGSFSFKLREVTGFQKTLRVDRLDTLLGRGDLAPEDLLDLAKSSGRLLAESHFGGSVVDGSPSALAFGSVDGEALAADIASFLTAYGPRLAADSSQFQALLEAEGPTLGFRGP